MSVTHAISGDDLRPLRLSRWRLDGWSTTSLLLCALIAAPILAVIGVALSPTENIWRHLASTVLPGYIATTISLMAGVGLGTVVIGVGTAWLVTMTRFPGRRVFEWALLLPMAIPAYVIAFAYTDLLEFSGPVQGALRALFGWTNPSDYFFPEIRSLGGAIAMMTLVLYPYVYLLSRAAFLEQSVGVLEVSRTLGRGPWRNFFNVALPLARPAIVVGLSLVMMETLNDFGTVDFFAVGTLTLGVFDVWLNMNNVGGAAQLAVLMLAFVLVLILAERLARRRQRYHQTSTKYQELPGRPLLRTTGWLAFGACFLPVFFGFLVPAGLLVDLASGEFGASLSGSFAANAANSLLLSGSAAVLALAIGVFLAYGMRLKNGYLLVAATRFASLGYAVPGAVLAIGVIIPLAALDNSFDGFMRGTFGVSTGLILSGTAFALIFAYTVRFLALAVGAVEASLARIPPNVDGAARTLGQTAGGTLRKVHLPLMRSSMLTAAILVFVDGMKELPMTVVMRPFNFETLATQVHQFAAAEQFSAAAPAALAIVATGILPVILLSLAIAKSRPGSNGKAGGGG